MPNQKSMKSKSYAKSEDIERNLSLYAKQIIKSEMGRKLVKMPDIAKKLDTTPHTLSTKISRGKFSTGFFFRILQILGTKEIPVPLESKDGYDLFNDS